MRLKRLEILIVCIFLFLELASFIGLAFPLRVFGQNVLNHRLWAYLVMAMILLKDYRVFATKSMLIVYLYFLIYLFMYAVGHYDLTSHSNNVFDVVNRFIPLSIIVAFSERYNYKSGPKDMRLFLRVSIFALAIASLASILVTIRYPQAVRGTEYAFINEDEIIYRRLGLGGYDLFSGLPFLLPLLVYHFKSKIIKTMKDKLFWILLIIVFTVCVYTGTIVAPIFLAFVLLFLAILGRRRFSINRWLIITLLFIVLITPGRFWGGILFSIGDSVKNTEIRSKIYDLGTLFSEGTDLGDVRALETSENQMETRLARAPTAIQTFLVNPIIGVGEFRRGVGAIQHMFWLSLFAQFGIIGAFPLIWLLYYSIRRNLARFDQEYKYYYLVSVLGFIALGFIKVIGGWFMYLMIFFIVPNMYYYNNKSPQQNSPTQVK